MKFSIIIPVKTINDYVKETVPYIQALSGYEWELFIVTDNEEDSEWFEDDRIKIIDSGRVGPADKRDLAAKRATGSILFFLDDDSYPEPNILEIASKNFTNTEVIALGGPGITPLNDSFWQRVSGATFLSKFTGGSPERYVSIGYSKEVDDWPSVNLMVRKNEFLLVGGFDTKYWPGEDTMLCLKLKKAGKKLIYEPKMIVWHHRRAGLTKHLKQVGAYGLHRGYFAKKNLENSFKPKYFLPSFFFIFFIISIFYNFLPSSLQGVVICGWLIYGLSLLLGAIDILKYERVQVMLVSLAYIFLTHLFYGLNFIYGFIIMKQLFSKLR